MNFLAEYLRSLRPLFNFQILQILILVAYFQCHLGRFLKIKVSGVKNVNVITKFEFVICINLLLI